MRIIDQDSTNNKRESATPLTPFCRRFRNKRKQVEIATSHSVHNRTADIR